MLASYRGQRLVDVTGNPALDIDAVRALLDFEISLGRVQRADGARWTVDLSTLPWREGQAAFASDFTGALDRLPRRGPRRATRIAASQAGCTVSATRTPPSI